MLLGCLIGLADRASGSGTAAGAAARSITVANLTLAIPTLALLTILPLTPLGFGQPPVMVALAVFAVPPLLANAYTGVRQVDPETRDAARGMGLSGGQLLRRVELPLAVPYLAAGLRTAAVQVVATAALAAFVNGGGLGRDHQRRLRHRHEQRRRRADRRRRHRRGRCSRCCVEGLLAVVQRVVTPRALRRGRRRPAPADRCRRATVGNALASLRIGVTPCG